MRRWAPLLLLGVSLALRAPAEESGFVTVDYEKLDRRILKEPAYTAKPLYALTLLDPAGKVRVWMVVDKSVKDLPYYDVLYFDRNANGDLTEEGERFTGTPDSALGLKYGMSLAIPIGSFQVPGTGLTHTGLKVMTVVKSAEKHHGFYFSMKWDGKVDVTGGMTADNHYTEWDPSPGKAPVLRPAPLGPLAFSFWLSGDLQVGGATRVNLLVGNPGSRTDTFCVFDEHFLIPGKDRIMATVIARGRDGKELKALTEIKGHC